MCDVVGCHRLMSATTATGRDLCGKCWAARLKYARDGAGWDNGLYVKLTKEWDALHDKKIRPRSFPADLTGEHAEGFGGI